MNAYSSRLHHLNVFDLLRYKLCSPPKLFPMKHSLRLYKSSILTFRGSQRLHILEFARNLNQNSIFFIDACFVNNSPKRGRLQEQKVCPHEFWILLDKTVKELTSLLV